MTNFKTLQDAHLALLARQDTGAGDPNLVGDAQAYIAEVITGSTWIADPGERDLLRAYLRYWAGVIYERTGVYPKTELRPAEVGASPAGSTTERPVTSTTTAPRPGAAPRAGIPGWLWLLGGLLALLLIAAAAFALLNRAEPPAVVTAEPSDRATNAPATPLPPLTRTIPPITVVPGTPIDAANAAQVSPLGQTAAHTGAALAVAFDPTRPEVATAGTDGRVRFWLLPDLTLSRQLNDQAAWVRTIAYSLYGGRSAVPPLFLTGGNDRALRVYELESLQLFAEYVPSAGNSGFVFAGRFSPNELVIASGHGDGVARVWNITSGTETQAIQNTRLAQIPSGGTGVQDVAYRSDGANLALALGGVENGLMVVDNSYSNVICTVTSGPALAVAYAPQSDLLAAGTDDGRLFLLSPNECQSAFEVPAHQGGVTDVAFSPSGDWLVTGGRDGTMKIWSPDGRALATLTAGQPVESVAVSPRSDFIGSADADGRLILWGIP